MFSALSPSAALGRAFVGIDARHLAAQALDRYRAGGGRTLVVGSGRDAAVAVAGFKRAAGDAVFAVQLQARPAAFTPCPACLPASG